MTLTSRENIWYLVIIITFEYLVTITGLESYNDYLVSRYFLSACERQARQKSKNIRLQRAR